MTTDTEHETTVAEIAISREKLLDTAERILRSKTREQLENANDYTVRDIFEIDELAVFDSLAWDRRQLVREAGRVYRVVRLQAQAGTSADRAAAKQAADEAAAKLDAEDDHILGELQKWQAKLDKLKKDAADAAAIVAKQEQAVEHLREAVPAHVTEQYHRHCAEIANEFAERKAAAMSDADRDEVEQQRLAARAEVKGMLDQYAR